MHRPSWWRDARSPKPPAPGRAQDLAWCTKIKGMTNCMYSTRQQCRASISGRNGTCIRNRHSG
ncbi:DUF3551 domain-containing protein [Bradyrhizobium sp. 14AA]